MSFELCKIQICDKIYYMVANNRELNTTRWNEDEDPLSIYEVAQLLNFKESTVSSWRQRHQMPKPDRMVSGGKIPLWKKKTIMDWAGQTNRLRNLQKDKFASTVDSDNINTSSLEDFKVEELDWNG